MKITYFPGCTLKTKALNMEDSALASLEALGAKIEEMPRWNCCGAVFSLSNDDLIHQIAPVRNLVRAMEKGNDAIVTLCSQCYNTLARANQLIREDGEKRDTINRFMDEELDYNGEVQVIHYLTFLREHIGWDALKKQIKVPLKGLKVAPFYGCTLLRPADVSIAVEAPRILEEFIEALGAEVVPFSMATECCGSYQGVANPQVGLDRSAKVIAAATQAGANAIVLSCPLCEYNLGTRQEQTLAAHPEGRPISTYYFTQLLAIALGLKPEVCHFDLNRDKSHALLKEKGYFASA